MVDILKLGWVKILNFKFSGNADVWLLKMKFDQDLRLNLRYDFGKMNSTLGSVVPLAMFIICEDQSLLNIPLLRRALP